MIKPDKKKWARVIFNPYEELLLRRNFNNFYTDYDFPQTDPQKGLLITPNHISWWDGFFIDYAVRSFLKRNFYIIMLEEQLRKYRFFSKLGAFSIEPSGTKGILETLDYAAGVLADPGNLLVYYPQGRIEPYDKQPITIKPGIQYLLRKNTSIDILPAAFRIEYGNKKKPSVYLKFGNLLKGIDVCSNFDLFKQEFTGNTRLLTSGIHKDEFRSDLFGRSSQ